VSFLPTDLIKQLLEAGVHFGHQTKRWNPKMKKFIFGRKSSIYIIDLEKTVVCLEEARTFLKDIVSNGKKILFVGTKKQAKDVIKQEAQRCGMPYVSERWIGGLLTNFATVTKRVSRFKEIKKMEEDGSLHNFTKKEASLILKEKSKLQQNFEGVEDMHELPGAIFIVDSKKEENAIQEARKLSIPLVALIDTNCDPDGIDYPIPGNDDAIKSIVLVASLVSSSIAEAINLRPKISEEEPETEEAKTQTEAEDTPKEEKKKVTKKKSKTKTKPR